jgi:hypothetical protein
MFTQVPSLRAKLEQRRRRSCCKRVRLNIRDLGKMDDRDEIIGRNLFSRMHRFERACHFRRRRRDPIQMIL